MPRGGQNRLPVRVKQSYFELTRTGMPGAEAATNNASLTDEQLLAFFPADSCFIAEADGRKILVFRSPELRQKYFH